MKAIEIEKIYTAKVAEYLANGYTIHPATMSGHQGEIAKIDLKKGDEIIRILLDRAHCWDREENFEIEGVVLRVGRNTDPLTQMRRPFDTWNTIWNEHLVILEERLFYQIDTNADFFTEDRAAYAAMRERRYQHWRNATLNQGITTQAISEAENPNKKALQIAQRYLKRRTGKSRIQIYGIDIAKRIPRTGRPEYTIIYNRRAYILH